MSKNIKGNRGDTMTKEEHRTEEKCKNKGKERKWYPHEPFFMSGRTK